MGFGTWLARALGEGGGGNGRSRHPHGHYIVDADDFGVARTEIKVGDLDGSGEAPGVQLEVEHQFTRGPVAVAYSGREAELVGRALLMAASEIAPHERLRQRRRKWHRAEAGDPPVQPVAEGAHESVDLAPDEIDAILQSTDPRLDELREKLRIPF